MTIEVDRDALLAATQAVLGVVASRNTIPILGNLLIEVENGRLTVTGTDLDLEATASVEAPGSLATTVDAQKMVAAVASFRPGKLTIAPVAGKSSIIVRQGRGQRTLSTLPCDDFPKRKPLADAVAFTMPAAMLARIVDCTYIAQSTDETRVYLQGIRLHVHEQHLRGVATDGFKLIRIEVPLPDGAEAMPGVIVPSKAVGHLRKLLAKAAGDVAIAVTSTAMTFGIGSSRLGAKLIDGIYPDYDRIIPEPGRKHRITCAPGALIEPVAAVAAVVNAEGDKMKVRKVLVTLGEADGHEVRSWDTAGTLASEPVEADVEGWPLEFGINHSFLKPVVDIFAESGTLSVELAGQDAPLRITGDKDPDLVAVIQTMKL